MFFREWYQISFVKQNCLINFCLLEDPILEPSCGGGLEREWIRSERVPYAFIRVYACIELIPVLPFNPQTLKGALEVKEGLMVVYI